MKKVLALSLFAIAAFVSQVWAAPCVANGVKVFCQWGADGCWQVDDSDESGNFVGCEIQAGYCPQLYTGATQGQGANQCSSSGGTPFTNCTGCWGQAAGVVWCDFGPPSQYGEGGCYQKTREDCEAEKGTVVSSQSECGKTPSTTGPFCFWPDGLDGCYCGVVDGAAATAANCTDDYGEIVTSCDGKCSANPPNPNPILKFTPASQALLVAPYGRSLHISSIKDATISLYDMSGAKVYSGKVRAGNSVFGLEKVPAGSYYAIVQSGSNYKKIAVVLK
ncbi:MAG: T9SS type A sorting domain-containing protein [Fibromonadaceae bacterium]|nr:T9SS type A sorting domain-containing protein [Fibromonadaceae bacterium]